MEGVTTVKKTLRIALLILATALSLSAAFALTACHSTPDEQDTTPDTTEAATPTPDDPTSKETEDMTDLTTEAPTEEITQPVEDPALNVFPEGGKNIEIGIFWEPPYEYTNAEQYDWIRDANITFIEITNREGAINKEANNLQLQLAAERGINVA